MDVVETQVQRTSPILRVTTDISELKPREQKYDTRASETSRSGRSGESNLRHASSLLQKKKQLRPIYSSPNPYRSSSYYATSAYTIHPNSKSNVSAFTQRIMSAKLLRVKQLQNELKETQVQLHEAINENRVLKTLQKRQDNALKKYDGDQAQLPQLIKSHNEELRVITTQYKQLKASNRELELKLRQRDSEFENLKEQYRHLIKLSRDKHLGHRERLTKQVEDLKEIVKEQNDRIQMLTRRCELESKNYKHQLNTEMVHHKDTQAELAMAHATIDSLKNLIEAKDKYINNTVPNRFYKQPTGHIMCAGNTRFRNLPKSTSSIMVHGKQESEETMNTTSIEQNGQDTDVTSDMSSGNRTVKNTQKIQIEPNNLNLRKRLTSRKLRTKNTNRSNVQLQPENEEENENDAETHYSSSFPSVDNSSKYNTSESDTVTRISSTIKGRRRVSIDSAHTIISDNFTNNEDEDDDDDDDNIMKSKDNDKNNTKEENNYNNKSNNIKKERNRRNSMSNYESDGPLESISESLAKAKAKDKLQRQQSIKDELKELEERLKNNNRKYSLEDPEESFDKLLERKTQSVKDELKEFETRLLNQNDLNSYSDSISKTFEEKADEVVRKMTAGLDLLPNNVDEDYGDEDCVDSDDESKLRKKFGFKDVTSSWNEMREKYQRERENTESLLDDYYKKMMINDNEETDDKNDTNESDLRLGEDEKEKLLKALKDIDRQTLGRKDSTDSETKERRNSLNYQFDFAATENHNVNSSYNYEFPSLQNINNIDDAEYSPKFDDDFVKSKAEVMEEIFGSAYKNAQETTTNDLGKS